jgi:hypothetical protein
MIETSQVGGFLSMSSLGAILLIVLVTLLSLLHCHQ